MCAVTAVLSEAFGFEMKNCQCDFQGGNLLLATAVYGKPSIYGINLLLHAYVKPSIAGKHPAQIIRRMQRRLPG